MDNKRKLTSNKIFDRMEEKGMSYRELAEKTEIGKSTLQRYVTNHQSKIPIENIVKIAKALDVSFTWLMGMSDNMTRKEINKNSLYEILNKEIQEGRTDIDTLAKICGVSADNVNEWLDGTVIPSMNILQKIADHLHIDKSKLAGINVVGQCETYGYKVPVFNSKTEDMRLEKTVKYENIDREMALNGEFFGIIVSDIQMEPRICLSDIVIVKKQSLVETGDIAAINIDDTIVVRKVRYLDDGIMLLSNNPTFDPLIFTNKDVQSKDVKILGKVVELRAKL